MKLTNVLTAVIVCSVSANAQTASQISTPAFRFQSLIATGANIGGTTLAPEVELRNFAVNSRGEVAMVVDGWSITGEHEFGGAVITANRIVAEEGKSVDGKSIFSILAKTLAIDERGSVAFEAQYEDRRGDRNLHTGLFHDRHLEFEIRGRGTPNDFTLTADGRIIPHGALYTESLQPPPVPAPQTAPGKGCGTPIKVKKHIWDTVVRNSPIDIPPDILSLPCSAPAKGKVAAAPVATPAIPVRLSVADDNRTPWTDNCRPPLFPTPANWPATVPLKGPITNATPDGPQSYRSPFFGQENKAVRVSYFAGCAAPQVVVIADTEHPTNFEVWSAGGLVTYSENGRIKTPGCDNPSVSGPITADVPALIVTRSGQIAFPVNLESFQGETGFAILLATRQ